MTLLDLSQLKQVLDTTTQDLFRWETLPAYEVASDGSDYRRYLDGADAPTPERRQPWLDTLRTWTDQGRPRRRVRIIHDPITDYERYACEWGYALNSQAGEIIRVIDLAHTPLPPELTRIAGDFWLIDSREVVAMHYQPDGQFGAAETLMAAQLDHLAELTNHPNLRLGVIPWDRPLTMHARHAFHLYDCGLHQISGDHRQGGELDFGQHLRPG